MSAQIIDGKEISAYIKRKAAEEAAFCGSKKRNPCLAVIIAGEDPASQIYVRNKRKACEECGIRSLQYTFGADVSEDDLTEYSASSLCLRTSTKQGSQTPSAPKRTLTASIP